MKRFFKFVGVIVLVLLSFSSCVSVEPGEAALKVYKLGEKKGEIEVLGVGRHALSIIGRYSIEKYPTYIQQYSWTAATAEGSGLDESIHFQAEGQDLSCDVGIAFTFNTDEKAFISMYKYFKAGPNEITARFLRKDVRNFFNEVSATMKVDEVYSSRKEELRQAVLQKMQEKYKPLGIEVQEISYLTLIKLPKEVQDAVNLKITAKQRAEQRENEIAEKEAEAKKRVAEAEGLADAARIEAKGRADAMRIEAEGRADAMRIEGKAFQANPQILRLRNLEMQTKLAESANAWKTVVLSADQSRQLLNIGGTPTE